MGKVQTTMRVLRERADMTQTDLAELLGRGQPEVSMWEWGKERMPDAIRHQVFGILRVELQGTYDTSLVVPEDLDRPWDEVLTDLDRRLHASEATS